MTGEANNGVQSEGRNRDYVVLEQTSLLSVIGDVLEAADIKLGDEQLTRIERLCADHQIYVEKRRVPSRNAAHALRQVGRDYAVGRTPPLVAVSERMFRPREGNVEAGDPRVSFS